MVSKEREKEILEKISKAGDSENYETSWDDRGLPISKSKKNIKQGKKSRAKGSNFELKVRKDLESKGRFVDKWNNNVDLVALEIVPAKRKYNPFRKAMVIGTGFPDFIAIKKAEGIEGLYSVIGVEVKVNGLLSKEEKEKCAFYLQKGVFSEIWIAKAVKEGNKVNIEYDDFREKYGNRMGQAP